MSDDNEAPDLRPDVWDRIAADPELKRARQKLSLHELRLIIQHAQNAPKDTRTKAEKIADIERRFNEAVAALPATH
jgi:hypothetical protein